MAIPGFPGGLVIHQKKKAHVFLPPKRTLLAVFSELQVREQCAVLLRHCCGKARGAPASWELGALRSATAQVKDADSTWQQLGSSQARVSNGEILFFSVFPRIHAEKRKIKNTT